jgi:hypothetical protein
MSCPAWQGVAACRAPGFSPCTLLLRAGTFYLSDTVMLGAADAYLTIAAYNSEEVFLSGAVPLPSPVWKLVSNSSEVWEVEQNENAVNHGTGAFVFSQTATWELCQAACQAHAPVFCNVWTWHDANQGGYANDVGAGCGAGAGLQWWW